MGVITEKRRDGIQSHLQNDAEKQNRVGLTEGQPVLQAKQGQVCDGTSGDSK